MRNYKTLIIAFTCGFICLTTNSCKKTRDFLEKAPGVDISESTTFSSVAQADLLLNTIYKFGLPSQLTYRDATLSVTVPLANSTNVMHPTCDMTDESESYEYTFASGNAWNRGEISASNIIEKEDYRYYQRWTALRQIAIFLENIDKVPDITPDYRDQVVAEVRTIRAYIYLEMVKRYGGVPIITEVIKPGVYVKLPRNTIEECFDFITSECKSVIDSKDLPAAQTASLMGRITSMVPYALRSRALLLAASPLFNTATPYLSMSNPEDNKLICFGNYDVNRWKAAEDAAYEALEHANSIGIKLIFDVNNRRGKYPGELYTQQITALPSGSGVGTITPLATVPVLGNYEKSWSDYNNSEIILTYQGYAGNNSGNEPWRLITPKNAAGTTWGGISVTLNHVMKYEKIDGTKQDWSNGGNDLTSKYRELDPRFRQTILYNNSYYSSARSQYEMYGPITTKGDLNENNITGNWMRKMIMFNVRTGSVIQNDIILRLNEIYLNYAEAKNEADPSAANNDYDNAKPAAILGNNLIAKNMYDAINTIRARSDMPALPKLSQSAFRERLRNERAVEMAFDDIRFWDIRRWMIAEEEGVMQGKMLGLKVPTKTGTGLNALYKWEPFTFEDRVFYRYMYLHPFVRSEVQKANGLIQNPGYQ